MFATSKLASLVGSIALMSMKRGFALAMTISPTYSKDPISGQEIHLR